MCKTTFSSENTENKLWSLYQEEKNVRNQLMEDYREYVQDSTFKVLPMSQNGFEYQHLYDEFQNKLYLKQMIEQYEILLILKSFRQQKSLQQCPIQKVAEYLFKELEDSQLLRNLYPKKENTYINWRDGMKLRVEEDGYHMLEGGMLLGTTYNCVGVFRQGSTEVIGKNEKGNRIVPSYIPFTETEKQQELYDARLTTDLPITKKE
jgi:hypothetical protein